MSALLFDGFKFSNCVCLSLVLSMALMTTCCCSGASSLNFDHPHEHCEHIHEVHHEDSQDDRL